MGHFSFSHYIDRIERWAELPVVDLYSYPPRWPEQLKLAESIPRKVIVIDDECLLHVNSKVRMGQYDMFNNCAVDHPGAIFLVKSRVVQQVLEGKGLRVVLCPWLFSLDDAISITRADLNVEWAPATSTWPNYFTLNNNYRMHKDYLLKQLQDLDWVKYGYITANDERFHTGKGIVKGNMSHYTFVPNAGYERVVLKDGQSTANAVNFEYIARSVKGCVNISAETSIREFFPTEKTLQPMAVGRLPLWVGKAGLVEQVREQGFDVFDDIVNHDYDRETNPKRRIKQMLADNQELLTGNNTQQLYNNAKNRLRWNQHHFQNQWLNTVSKQLIKDIEK